MQLLLKRLLLLVTLNVTLTFILNAQSIHLDWVKTMPFSHGSKLVIDSNKSIILAGGFQGTQDFDPGPGVFNMTAAGYNLFIARYDTAGNFIWAKQLQATESDVVRDKFGNLLILGEFQYTVDFDPGPGVQTLTSPYLGAYLLKLDPGGNFLWVKQIPHELNTLGVDAGNNIILGGSFAGTQDFDPGPGTFTVTAAGGDMYPDMAIVKLNGDGNFTWMRQVLNQGTGEQQTRVLKIDPEDNIILAGNFSSAMDFDPGAGATVLTPAGHEDAFLLKLDKAGNFQWARRFGAGSTDRITGLEIDGQGNVYSTGMFLLTVDFDPGPGTYEMTGAWITCFVSKLDKNGNFVYAKSFQSVGGSTDGNDLALDRDNNLYISGYYGIDADFDPGPGVNKVTGYGLFTVKLDDNGNLAWAATYPAIGAYYVESIYSDLAVDILKNVYLTGEFGYTTDFDPTAASFPVTAASSDHDLFFHKLSQCGNTWSSTAADTCTSYTLNGTTYPSPGVYYQFLRNSAGCDSVISLTLHRKAVITQQTATACDSYTWNGRQQTTTGIYRDTFPAVAACDSIVQLDLTITKISTDVDQTACGAYLWNGTLLTSSGQYSHTFKTAGGCDSLVNLNLVINPAPQKPFLGADTTLCKGDTIRLSPGAFQAYLWSNGSTGNTLTVADTGAYWVQVTGDHNCTAADTMRILSSGQCGCVLDEQTKVYPNPFDGFLLVDKQPTSCEIRMDLYNTLGQLLAEHILLQDGVNRIPLPGLPAAVYFYRLYSKDKILLRGKVLKQ